MAAWKRLVVTGLVVSLPVPVFAATGLAVPLPSIVYRVAVGIAERTQAVAVGVPGFQAVVSEGSELARPGTIKLSAKELAVGGVATERESTLAPDDAGANGPEAVGRPRARGPLRAVVPPESVAGGSPGQAEEIPAMGGADSGSEFSPSQEPLQAPAQRATEVSPPVPAHKPQRSEGTPPTQRGETPSTPRADTPARTEEPKPTAPKEDPKGGSDDTVPVPSPLPVLPQPFPVLPPSPPPSTLPPVVVVPPIEPLPAPVSGTPEALLHGIADDLRLIAPPTNDSSGPQRVAAALERVEDARARLVNTQEPDNGAALNLISNAIQKLDQAMSEGSLGFVEGTLFVNRLNAVSHLLDGSIQ